MYWPILFLVKLLDPLAAILGLTAGAMARTWWHTGLGALVAAALVELALSHMQPERRFEFPEFVVGCLAAFVWVALAFFIKQRAAAKRAGSLPPR